MRIATTKGRDKSVRTMRYLRDERGFTLVELVVTLVIIGALAAVSAPLFFSRQGFEQSGFFNETLSAVRYAQKLAVASGCTVRVQITSTGYTLYRDVTDVPSCTDGPFTQAIVDPSGTQPTFTRTAPSGIALSPQDFNFRPLGDASFGTPTVDITVGSQTMRVWAVTGFVERL